MPPKFEFSQPDLDRLRLHIEAVEEFLNHPRATDMLTRIDIGELSDGLDIAINALNAYEKHLEQVHKAKP